MVVQYMYSTSSMRENVQHQLICNGVAKMDRSSVDPQTQWLDSFITS